MNKLKLLLTIILCFIYVTPIYADHKSVSKTVKTCTGDWEPYMGLTLPDYGPVLQIVTRVFKQAGYTVKYEFYP